MKHKKKPVALTLGGGGARGFAHIGVLKVLEEESIPVDIITGTSVGALIGGAYAGGTEPQKLIEIVDEYLSSDEFQSSAMRAISEAQSKEDIGITRKVQQYLKNRFYLVQMMFKPGIVSIENFEVMINHFIPDINIEDTSIPFRPVATDLMSGEEIVFSEGSLRQAVIASCAVPGAIEPMKSGERILSDGGIVSSVPIHAAREAGAHIVIAVTVAQDIIFREDFQTALSVYSRAADIMSYHLMNHALKEADIVIRPRVGSLDWSDYLHAKDLIYEGERATRDSIESIKKVLSSSFYARVRNFFK
ncbi:MAG: patatin-like phospholipase family protein [Deltaproteobacteria bacterium]|nr:patatin-like phospholipase family protein [Deltaproteobacteria bacterium]